MVLFMRGINWFMLLSLLEGIIITTTLKIPGNEEENMSFEEKVLTFSEIFYSVFIVPEFITIQCPTPIFLEWTGKSFIRILLNSRMRQKNMH